MKGNALTRSLYNIFAPSTTRNAPAEQKSEDFCRGISRGGARAVKTARICAAKLLTLLGAECLYIQCPQGLAVMLKKFLRYVLPSMVAFAFTGLYSIVDGFFVGNNVGDEGLAAINVAYPLVALINAVGTGIGMGGSVMLSMARGSGDVRSEKRYLGNTLAYLLLASVVNGYADTYIFVLACFATVQIFSTGCVPLLRNFGVSFGAMAAMAAGFITNILLDWLFVQRLGEGIFGAALATGLGQVVTVLPCAVYLVRKIRAFRGGVFSLSAAYLGRITRVGLSPFGVLLCPQIITIILNKFLFVHGDELYVAAYSVIMYVYCVDLLLLQGVGDGTQPLISEVHGEGNGQAVLKLRNYAYIAALAVAAVLFVVLFLCRDLIPEVFGAGEFTARESARILPYFAGSALFTAFSKITASYFYSMDRNIFAYAIVYGEVAAILVLVLTLPLAWGIDGVWMSLPISQVVIAVLAVKKRTLRCVWFLFSDFMISLFQRAFKRLCDERLCLFVLRIFKNLIRRANLFDYAVRHENDLVGNAAREVHLVCDDNHRAVARFQPLDDLEHFARELGVEGGGRLVETEYVG